MNSRNFLVVFLPARSLGIIQREEDNTRKAGIIVPSHNTMQVQELERCIQLLLDGGDNIVPFAWFSKATVLDVTNSHGFVDANRLLAAIHYRAIDA